MKDIIDTHRESISAAAATRDKAIIDATATFQAAVSVYRDATQRATDEYSAAVTASEAALDVQMEQRTRDFFGEVPVHEPVIRITAPQPPMPRGPEAGYANGAAEGMQP
jgi:hypothetical protein